MTTRAKKRKEAIKGRQTNSEITIFLLQIVTYLLTSKAIQTATSMTTMTKLSALVVGRPT